MPVLRFLLALALAAPLAPAAAQSFNPFLLPDTPVSAYEVGFGSAATFAPTENPYTVTLNPALLADAGARPGLRVAGSIAPSLYGFDDLLVGSSALSVGLRSSLAGRPLHIGLGGSYSEINLDNVQVTNELGILVDVYDTQERASGGGLGIGWEGPVTVRVGAAAFYREAFEQPLADASGLGRDRATTLDIGTAVTLPVLRGPSASGETEPVFSVTAGYTRRHITLATDFYDRGVEIVTSGPEAPPEAGVVGGAASLALVRQFGTRGRFRIARLGLRAESERSGGLSAAASAPRSRWPKRSSSAPGASTTTGCGTHGPRSVRRSTSTASSAPSGR